MLALAENLFFNDDNFEISAFKILLSKIFCPASFFNLNHVWMKFLLITKDENN